MVIEKAVDGCIFVDDLGQQSNIKQRESLWLEPADAGLKLEGVGFAPLNLVLGHTLAGD